MIVCGRMMVVYQVVGRNQTMMKMMACRVSTKPCAVVVDKMQRRGATKQRNATLMRQY